MPRKPIPRLIVTNARKPKLDDIPISLIRIGEANGLSAADIAKIALERRFRRIL